MNLNESEAEETMASQARNIGLGYRISQTEDVAKVAFGFASDLVRKAISMGAELRVWGSDTKDKTHQLLKLGDKFSEENLDHKKVEAAIAEVLRWEDEISRSIRTYFIQISDLLNKLKKLNPPLKTEQLDPYLEAILADRRATMAALESLSGVIHKITELKTQVWFEASISPRPL